jgi:hypothetical protein
VFDRKSFKHGQIVRNASGRRIGIIDVCGEEKLYLRKNGWTHHWFTVAFAQVAGIQDGDVVLKQGEEHVEPVGPAGITEKMVQLVKPFHEATFLAGGHA